MKIVLIVAALLLFGSEAAAGPYAGATAMKCTIQTVMVCNEPSTCVRGTAATVNLPPVLTVDVGNKLISGAATGRTVQIISIDRGAGKMMLRGLDVQTLGIAWDLVVDEKSGSMAGAVLSQGGYLLFGRCAAP
ncbi:MAG TPA: hypothetical protein VIE36_11140 [Methylomirabilota bacterium]|jgi:hypothetical protein